MLSFAGANSTAALHESHDRRFCGAATALRPRLASTRARLAAHIGFIDLNDSTQ
jgi:hypothetical protein